MYSKRDNVEVAGYALGGCVLVIALLIAALTLSAGLIFLGWNLFLVPVFGIAPLEFPYAIGAAILLMIITGIFRR